MNPEYNTLDRIQNEIRETLIREEELKSGHILQNGETEKTSGINTTKEGKQKVNGFRRFNPNITTKGVMQKFFKSRGKFSASLKSADLQDVWVSDAAFQPAKLTVEKGKPLRNGYVPTEEKIVKELHDFQIREAELRKERFKSQPNLMASLDLENSQVEEEIIKETSILKPAKSMANLYQPEHEEDVGNSTYSLKPAKSLAALCDLEDDEIELPGTHSLIKQFESLRIKKEGCV